MHRLMRTYRQSYTTLLKPDFKASVDHFFKHHPHIKRETHLDHLSQKESCIVVFRI